MEWGEGFKEDFKWLILAVNFAFGNICLKTILHYITLLGSKWGRILGAAGLGAMGGNRAIIMSITNVNVLKNTQPSPARLQAVGSISSNTGWLLSQKRMPITGQKQYFLHVPSEEKVTELRHPDFWCYVGNAQVDSKTMIIRKEK